MSYKINTTNGDLLVDLIDGKIDTVTTDLTLVGRNYTGYGEAFNENFVKLLENFASTSQPDNPIRGQVWYDTSDGRLKVFDGEVFRSTDTTAYTSVEPTLLEGDIWIDSRNKQMYFSDGVQKFLVGPNYTSAQNQTDIDAITLVDKSGRDKVVARLSVGGTPVALISKESFTAANIDENIQYLETVDAEFSTQIKQGINLTTNLGTFYWQGSALNAFNLIDNDGDIFSSESFVKRQYSPADPADTAELNPQTVDWSLAIVEDAGLTVGSLSNFKIYVDNSDINDDVVLEGTNPYKKIKIKGTYIDGGPQTVDAVTIVPLVDNDARVGILNPNPGYNLDVNGDVRVQGNLIVDGTTTELSTVNLQIEDKQVQLAVTEIDNLGDSTLLNDAALDDSGIVIVGGPSGHTDNLKSWTWRDVTDSWTSHTNIDIPANFSYKINGQTILTSTALGNSVTTATGLTQIGTLNSLTVDDVSINGSTIAVANDFRFDINGDFLVSISPSNPISKIKHVADPVDDQDAATKIYVDEAEEFQNVWLSLDITGISNSQIADIINDLIPATTKRVGVECRVHCTADSGNVTTDVTSSVSKSFVNVDSNGVQHATVLANVAFSAATDTVNLSVTRSLKKFIVNTAQEWEFDEDLVSSV